MQTRPLNKADVEALALRLKTDIDRLLYRFAGKPFTPALAKRIELAVRNEIARNPVFEPLRSFEPAVYQDKETGRPLVYFLPPPPEPANANEVRRLA